MKSWEAPTVRTRRSKTRDHLQWKLSYVLHFTLDDDLIDPLFRRWRTTYDGPVLLMNFSLD